MTSLLTPDVNQLQLFTEFPEWGSVLGEMTFKFRPTWYMFATSRTRNPCPVSNFRSWR
jgi:hypothetical protein